MLTYIVRRILVAIPTVFGVATVVFFLRKLLPGDPAIIIAGPQATPEAIANIRHQLGLDQPVWQQYLTFMGGLIHGDLGISSRTGAPVIQEIATRAPYTAELAADVGDCLGRGLRPGDDAGRVAGQELLEEENHRRHPEHGRDRDQEAPNEVGQHGPRA